MRGIIIARWDDRLGVVLEGAHPKSISESLSDDDLLTIFSTHAISEKAGVMAMRIKRLNIISYYSGLPEGEQTDQFFVALILDPDEDPNPYEEGLSEIANMIIPTVGKPGFAEFFAESFNRISKYVSISEEQRYSFIFRDNTRRLLLERLANGPMTKEGLAKWLSKEVGEEITDIEGLLNPLRKTDLIEEINISKGKKVTLEFVFLIRDVAVIRTPHVELFQAAKEGQMPADIRDKYIDDVTRFFKDYRITAQDTVYIANVVSEPDSYEILNLLRKEYVTRAELPAKIGREIPNLEKLLKDLAEHKVITAIKDKKERVWVMLLSDIIFPNFFPEYMVDVIRRRWKEGTIQKEIALKHLELLRAEYIATQAPKYRRKLLATIKTIFDNAEKSIARGQYDQAATRLETIANYTRDMGARPTAEVIDKAAKAIREDRDQYIEEKWDEDRAKILNDLQEIEEQDKAKEEAKKAKKQKQKKDSKKKQAKKQPKKKQTKKQSKEEIVQEETEETFEDDLSLTQDLSSIDNSAPTSTPQPPVAPPQADATEQPIGEESGYGFEGMNLKELQKYIKTLLKKGISEEVIAAFGQLAKLFEEAGDSAKAEKTLEQKRKYEIALLQNSENSLLKAAKTAQKKKNFAEAAELYGELVNISNILFKQGLMNYSEKAKKYQKLKSEMESKS